MDTITIRLDSNSEEVVLNMILVSPIMDSNGPLYQPGLANLFSGLFGSSGLHRNLDAPTTRLSDIEDFYHTWYSVQTCRR
jgi:hypothetical protein